MRTPGKVRCRELGSEGAMIYPDCADKRESGKPICRVDMRDTLTDFANAHFITKVWNCHDELVAALEALLEDIDNAGTDYYSCSEDCRKSMAMAYEALAKVKSTK